MPGGAVVAMVWLPQKNAASFSLQLAHAHVMQHIELRGVTSTSGFVSDCAMLAMNLRLIVSEARSS